MLCGALAHIFRAPSIEVTYLLTSYTCTKEVHVDGQAESRPQKKKFAQHAGCVTASHIEGQVWPPPPPQKTFWYSEVTFSDF